MEKENVGVRRRLVRVSSHALHERDLNVAPNLVQKQEPTQSSASVLQSKPQRSVSFSLRTESRSYNVEAPSTSLGDVMLLDTKTKTPPTSRYLRRPTQERVPTLQDTIREDDLAFSFLDTLSIDDDIANEEWEQNDKTYEDGLMTVEEADRGKSLDDDQQSTEEEGNDAVTSTDDEGSEIQSVVEPALILGPSSQRKSMPSASDFEEESVYNETSPLSVEKTLESIVRRPLSSVMQEVSGWVEGFPPEAYSSAEEPTTNVSPENIATPSSGQVVLNTILPENEAVMIEQVMVEETESISSTEEEVELTATEEEADSIHLRRSSTATTLLVEDDEPILGSQPPLLRNLIPPELSSEVNAACDLMLLAKLVVAPAIEDFRGAFSLAMLDVHRHGINVERIEVTDESSEPNVAQTETTNAVDQSAKVQDSGIPNDLPCQIVEAPTLHHSQRLTIQHSEESYPQQESHNYEVDDRMPQHKEEDKYPVEEPFPPPMPERAEEIPSRRRFELDFLRADTYEAPPMEVKPPAINLASLIHLCTYSSLPREVSLRRRERKRYPRHTLAMQTPERHIPNDSIAGFRFRSEEKRQRVMA